MFQLPTTLDAIEEEVGVVDLDADAGVAVGEKLVGVEATTALPEVCVKPSKAFASTMVPSGGAPVAIIVDPPVES